MEPAETASSSTYTPRRAGWTLPALLIGLGTIAACLLVPQVEENRRIRYDLELLKAQHAQIEEQIRVNDEFLAKVAVDPTLMTRLAQRQLRLMPSGTETLELKGMAEDPRSPFQLVTVPQAKAMAPYKPWGGELLAPLRDGRTRLYLMGAAFFIVAASLILDGSKKTEAAAEMPVPQSRPQNLDHHGEENAMSDGDAFGMTPVAA